jgi:hypothetical protein
MAVGIKSLVSWAVTPSVLPEYCLAYSVTVKMERYVLPKRLDFSEVHGVITP